MAPLPGPTPRRYRIEDLTLDAGQHRLWRGEAEIELSKLTFKLLLALVEAAPNLLTQDQLADAVWGSSRVVSPENLAKRVMILRQALGDSAEQPRYIAVVRGQGLRLVAHVEPEKPDPGTDASAASQDQPRAAHTADAGDTGPRSAITGQRFQYIVTALLALAVAFMALDGYVLRNDLDATGNANDQQPTATGAARVGPPYRIAVMPLRSVSLDREDREFADGLTFGLISRLAQIEELELTEATSSFALAERTETARAIGEALQVDFLLEGDLRADPENLRISLRLVDWGDSSFEQLGPFNRRRGEQLALQDQIAEQVVEALNITLGVGERTEGYFGTENPEAYDAYLRGRALASQIRLPDAVAYFERALELDEDFGLVWFNLANAYAQLQYFPGPFVPEERRSRRSTAIQRALDTIPERWESHALHAFQLVEQRNWIGAAREFEIAANSRGTKSPVEWGLSRGAFLWSVGRIADMLPYYLAARSADPLSVNVSGQTAWALDVAGETREAIKEFERHRELAGGVVLWFSQYLHAALDESDWSRIEQALAGLPQKQLARDLAVSWDSPREAAALLRHGLLDTGEFPGGDPTQNGDALASFAAIAAYFGDTELAIDILREAVMRRKATTGWFWHPLLADVRQTAGFKTLVIETGLPGYWREYEWADACRPVGDEDFTCE